MTRWPTARNPERWDLADLKAVRASWYSSRKARVEQICQTSRHGRCQRCSREAFTRLVARKPYNRARYTTRRNRGRICRRCLEIVVSQIELVADDPYWDPEAARATWQAWQGTRGPRSSDRQPASTP